MFALEPEIANVLVDKFGIAKSVVVLQFNPALSVIQTPPPTVALYHLFGLFGATTILLPLPGMLLGPLSSQTTFGRA